LLARVITQDWPNARNLIFGMKVVPNNRSKKSCSINNGCHGYLMTSSQNVKISENICEFEDLVPTERKNIFKLCCYVMMKEKGRCRAPKLTKFEKKIRILF